MQAIARDLVRRSKRQRGERERAIRAPGRRQRRRPDDEEVSVIVCSTEAVADAGRRVGSHPAAARRVIEIAAFAGREDLAVVLPRELREQVRQMAFGVG